MPAKAGTTVVQNAKVALGSVDSTIGKLMRCSKRVTLRSFVSYIGGTSFQRRFMTYSSINTMPAPPKVVVVVISVDLEGIDQMADRSQLMPVTPRVRPVFTVVPNSSRFTPHSPTSLGSLCSRSKPYDVNVIPVSNPDNEAEFPGGLSSWLCLALSDLRPKGAGDVSRTLT